MGPHAGGIRARTTLIESAVPVITDGEAARLSGWPDFLNGLGLQTNVKPRDRLPKWDTPKLPPEPIPWKELP